MEPNFINRFMELASGAGLTAILVFLGINFITGMVAAIKSKTWTLKDALGIWTDKLLPYTAVYLMVVVLATIDESVRVLIPIASASVSTVLLAAIAKNFDEMGVILPEAIKKWLLKIP